MKTAARVYAKPPPGCSSSLSPARSRLLQRKSSCDARTGFDGECDDCRQKNMQRSALSSELEAQSSSSIPPTVQDVLRSPGQPLDVHSRAFMEPRFGHDFSQVRVFADSRAEHAAEAVQARAFTYGRNIVFGPGEYAPATAQGKTLLAHELAHVVQQSHNLPSGAPSEIGPGNDPAEVEAEHVADSVVSSETLISPAQISQSTAGMISKQAKPPSRVNCPAGHHGAPANAEDILDSVEMLAILATTLASAALGSLQLDAVLPGIGQGGGFTMPAGPGLQHYSGRFGLPPAAGKGKFRNRLSGATFASQAQALVEETKSLQDRYSRISDFLGGSKNRFRCITNPTTVGGCTGDCAVGAAFGCPTVIMLCPRFWTFSLDVQSQLLIHEAAHTVFRIYHDHNFRHADCYAAYAADARGVPSPTTSVCTP